MGSKNQYVTDGPQLYRQDRQAGDVVGELQSRRLRETIARSRSGTLQGSWEQLEPLVGGDSGHGMLFKTFEGQWMLVLHHPFGKPTTRAHFYEMEDTVDTFRVVRPRADLDGRTSD